MRKKYPGGITTIMTVVLCACLPALADHFPARAGTWWEFGYQRDFGGWGSVTHDSGTMRWDVAGIEIIKTFPAQTRMIVTTAAMINRRTFTPGFLEGEGVGYDSVFSPPRVTFDTMVLRGIDGVNGLWIEGDTCWTFVLDPAVSIPAGRLTLTDVRVKFGADSVNAVKVDPAVYVSRYADQTYYVTADGIGPLIRSHRSSRFLMDAFWSDSLWLIRTNAGTTRIRTPYMKPIAGRHPGHIAQYPIRIYNLDGRRSSLSVPGIRLLTTRDGIFSEVSIKDVLKQR